MLIKFYLKIIAICYQLTSAISQNPLLGLYGGQQSNYAGQFGNFLNEQINSGQFGNLFNGPANNRPIYNNPLFNGPINTNNLYPGLVNNNLNNVPINNDLIGQLGSNLLGGQIMTILESINQNDDLKCIPKLLCRIIGERNRGGSFINNYLPTSLIYQIPDLPIGNYLFTLGRAAILGFVGGPYGCDESYPECPQDEDDLLYYLNNHKGGFFRFFNSYQGRNFNKPNSDPISDIAQNVYKILKNSSNEYQARNNLKSKLSSEPVNRIEKKLDLNIGEILVKNSRSLDFATQNKTKNDVKLRFPRRVGRILNKYSENYNPEYTTKWKSNGINNNQYNNQYNYETTNKLYFPTTNRYQNEIHFNENNRDEITPPNRYNERDYYTTSRPYDYYSTRRPYYTTRRPYYTTRNPYPTTRRSYYNTNRPYYSNQNYQQNNNYNQYQRPTTPKSDDKNIYVTNSRGVIEYYISPNGQKVYI